MALWLFCLLSWCICYFKGLLWPQGKPSVGTTSTLPRPKKDGAWWTRVPTHFPKTLGLVEWLWEYQPHMVTKQGITEGLTEPAWGLRERDPAPLSRTPSEWWWIPVECKELHCGSGFMAWDWAWMVSQCSLTREDLCSAWPIQKKGVLMEPRLWPSRGLSLIWTGWNITLTMPTSLIKLWMDQREGHHIWWSEGKPVRDALQRLNS